MTALLDARDPRCADPSLVGGKAASLARLVRHGAPVPPFLVVPAGAQREAGGEGVDETLASAIRTALEGTFNPDTALAVRSSAIGEDGVESSFAGVFDTVLDVRGAAAVIDAVEACWASFDGTIAAGYRADRRVSGEGGMAVVIQEMVDRGWAGVCFTADPAILALSRGVVEGAAGGGEAIVSGEVTGARAVVEHAGARIVERRADADGHHLPTAVVEAVWRESCRIADIFGFPQDTEWSASADGRLSILQSRPITTIRTVVAERPLEPWRRDPGAIDDPERLWTRALSDEVWSPPVSPLFYTLHDMSGYFRGHHALHGDRRPLPVAVQKYHQAAVYFDVDVLARTYSYLPRFARTGAILDFFPSARRQAVRDARWRWAGWLRRFLIFELRRRPTHSLRHAHRHLDRLLAEFGRTAERWADIDVSAMDEEQLWAHLRTVMRSSARIFEISNVTVMYHAFDLRLALTGLLDRWIGGGELAYANASVGLEGVSTVAEADLLWQLASSIREDPARVRALSAAASWEELAGDPANAGTVAAVERFGRAHRHRGATYKDVIYPRWGDEPDVLLDVVRSYVTSTARRPLEANRERAAERVAGQRALLDGLRGPLARPRRLVLSLLFRLNEAYQRQRDDYRFQLDHVWYEARRVYAAIGVRLRERQLLASSEDVFFLGHREVRDASKGALERELLAERVAARRAAWDETQRELPARFLRAYAPLPEAALEPSDGDTLEGVAASPGSAVGRARVIADVRELAGVEDGDVVVTRRTDPGWASAFPRLGGVVLETGSSLSHAASLCREFSLPCVTAVAGATTRIADGEMVEVLGSEGRVRLLAGNETRR